MEMILMKVLRPLFVLALLLFFGSGDARAVVTDGDSASGSLDLRGESNVTFSQRTDGSRLVDIRYTLDGGTSSVALGVSLDGGTTFTSVKTLTGDVGAAVSAGTAKQIVWNAGADYPNLYAPNVKMRVTALLDGAGGTFAPIPGGTYQMGNLIGDSDITNAGTVSVTLSAYYMSVNDTTKAQWDAVRTWATGNGYTDLIAGAGSALDHPVHSITWYDVVKWINAASEREGLAPCYRVGGTVYRTGVSNAVSCDWTANGYRLPTEAEWEVAARGGLIGKRFPWGDTISQSQANYTARPSLAYDLSGQVNDLHPVFKEAGTYTSPVGSFAANGYGLYDMAGNVFQWCWDLYATNYAGGVDPRGAVSGSNRVLRGGYWYNDMGANCVRCAFRRGDWPPSFVNGGKGFRLARARPSGTGTGTISVAGAVDAKPPLVSVPGPVSVSAPSASGAIVTLSGASATDNLGTPTLTYSPASGSTFPVGTTTVTVTATDSVGNVATGTFSVTVSPPPSGVTGVTFSQRTDGSKLVDIRYTLNGGTRGVALGVSLDGGTTFTSVKTLTGDVGAAVTAGTSKLITWNAGADYANLGAPGVKVRVTPLLDGSGGSFTPIPGGTFQMGNLKGDADITNAGTVSVTLSPYSMAVGPTTKAQWDAIRTWGASNGYTDLALGEGKAADHPVQRVSWYDALKWANAASEKEGLAPCYKVGGSVVRSGTSDTVSCDWSANGYRLPTEAEWEVAARGGLSGKRFPWGDTISHSQANYKANPADAYDLSASVNDHHPAHKSGVAPYTNAVGSFAANGYGLYDMAGNVWQWCWDRFEAPYAGGVDPRGGTTGWFRVFRGGLWYYNASMARSAGRYGDQPAFGNNSLGFRLVRGRAAGSGDWAESVLGAVDNVPPVLSVGGTVSVTAMSASGAAVALSSASATDNIGTPVLTYSPASGSTFAVGTTTVTVTATDSMGNKATGTFKVTVAAPAANIIGAGGTLALIAGGYLPDGESHRRQRHHECRHRDGDAEPVLHGGSPNHQGPVGHGADVGDYQWIH
jgi:formylglycine-generating enzyme